MIVIEASAMVGALVDDPAVPELLALLADEELHAPALLDFEVVSALRGHLLGGRLDEVRADEALEDFAALQIERHQMTDALGRMLDLRENFTAYDSAYVVLALGLQAPLVTSDQKMAEAARLGVQVQFIPGAA
ncbi:MAG: VapC toxin family PIN domain ribonuclease [Pseudonocardiales bacterium]|nr:type II toxin-antitoxin system VapC family toxin [Actinomycetota bacterium]PZS23904.1 MAG: VapC toxin family PIN domain ribonuclease [Pseudonocardiales bacterium]